MKTSEPVFTILMMYIVSSIGLTALSIPLILRKVKPNHLYGFRVPSTLADPELWYSVNAYAGKRLFVAGIIDLAAAIGFYFIPGLTIDGYAYLCLGVMGITLTYGVVQSFRYLKTEQHKN